MSSNRILSTMKPSKTSPNQPSSRMDIIINSFFIFTILAAQVHPTSAREKNHRYAIKQKNFEGYCELEISCKGEDATNLTLPIKLPIKGPRGPPGPVGPKGERGNDGAPGVSANMGMGSSSRRKIAFFVGLTENFGPVGDHTDIVFDRVVTNVGSAYNPSTGRFTAPVNGVYQFNVIVSAQGRQKAAVMVLKNGDMVATVWAESLPYWATASNIAVLSLERGDQVWLLLLTRASYLHGYMYTTFSGFIIFDQ